MLQPETLVKSQNENQKLRKFSQNHTSERRSFRQPSTAWENAVAIIHSEWIRESHPREIDESMQDISIEESVTNLSYSEGLLILKS